MRLLFLDSIDKDVFGGYENWILLVAKYFARKGHQVTVAGRPGSEYLRRVALASKEIDILEVRISGDFNPFTINRLRKVLSGKMVDIITVNFNKDVRLGGLASRWYGRCKVIWRIGLDITKNSLINRLLVPRLVDGIIVPSNALKTQILRHGYIRDEMVEVIYNGTEDKTFVRPDGESARALRKKYGLSEKTLVAVTSGRFVNQKGHIYLIQAARSIVARRPEIVFLFLGNGPLRNILEEHVNSLGLGRHFLFAGMLDNVDLELAGADLMIHPAIEEPFSHAILEGMRAGLPIVASRVGGIPEAVTDNVSALLVEPGNPRQLRDAVVEMLSSPEKRHSFGQANQRRWYEEFRLETMLSKVEVYMHQTVSIK
jgi:glycosyltransferase involved in cell wall biosynthesis